MRSEFWWAGVVAGRVVQVSVAGLPVPWAWARWDMGGMASIVRRRGTRQVITGSVVFLIGLMITFFTYSNASSSHAGGTYVVAWGPMAFGIITIIRRLLAISRAQRLNR